MSKMTFGKKLWTFFLIMSITIVTASHLQVKLAFAQSPTIYVDPSDSVFYTDQKFIGDRFNVTIRVSDAPQFGGWGIGIIFNDTLINATRWFEPTSDPEYVFFGRTTSAAPTPPTFLYTHGAYGGRVRFGATLFPVPPAQTPGSGNGKLCILEFKITSAPSSGSVTSLLNIHDGQTTLVDPYNTDLPIPGLVKQDGSYTYVFVTPPPLYFSASPAQITFSPYQDAVNYTFNTQVFVNSATSAADLRNASFSMSYDPSVLFTSDANISFNTFWTSQSSLVSGGVVGVSVANPSSMPVGDVWICNVTFTIQDQPTSPPQDLGTYADSGMNFVYGRFLDGGGHDIAQLSSQNASLRLYAYRTEPATLAFSQPIASGGGSIAPGREFTINVTSTSIYNPSAIQVKILYDPNVINCTEEGKIVTTGAIASFPADHKDLSQPGILIVHVSISEGFANPLISGSLFKITFRAVAIGISDLNFSQPYGQDTYMRDASGSLIGATYSEAKISVGVIGVSNIQITDLQVPTEGISDRLAGLITIKQTAGSTSYGTVRFTISDSSLAITPNPFTSSALSYNESYTQQLDFNNTASEVTKSVQVLVEVDDQISGNVTDQRIFNVTIVPSSFAIINITVRSGTSQLAIKDDNVTIAWASSTASGVTGSTGTVVFRLDNVTSGTLNITVSETSAFLGNTTQLTLHPGVNKVVVYLANKAGAVDVGAFLPYIVVIVVIAVVGVGVYLYRRHKHPAVGEEAEASKSP